MIALPNFIRPADQVEGAVHIPLRRARFCTDCETVFSSAGPRCPVCGSPAVAPLMRWVQPMPETARHIAG